MKKSSITDKIFTTHLIEKHLLMFFGTCIILDKKFNLINSSKSISQGLQIDLDESTGLPLKDLVEIQGVDLNKELENKLKEGFFMNENYRLKIICNSVYMEVCVSGFYTGLICDLNDYIILRITIKTMDNHLFDDCTSDELKWNNFLYKVSHNIRGPIATIKGLAMIAELEKYSSSENKFYFEQIYQHADILDNYLKSLHNLNQ